MGGVARGLRPFLGVAGLGVGVLLALAVLVQPTPAAAPGTADAAGSGVASEPAPGVPADSRVASEIEATLTRAIQQFKSMDAPAVLSHISEAYRTGPLTKPMVRQQLATMFGVYDAVDARVRIDDVRWVNNQAWIYSTGQVYGRVRWVGTWVQTLAWERELEVARREQGAWKLFGYQQ